MTQIIKIDMHAFVKTVTHQMDMHHQLLEGCYIIILNGRFISFKAEWLHQVFRYINGVFYRCNGGWLMELEIRNNRFTGNVAFVPVGSLGPCAV